MIKQFMVLVFACFLLSCQSTNFQKPDAISLVELVENKDKYHDKKIWVRGYIGYTFEGCVIFAHDPTEKSKYTSLDYWVWYWDKGCMTQTKNPKYGNAFLFGTYNKNDKGHLGSYNSSLNVEKILWE